MPDTPRVEGNQSKITKCNFFIDKSGSRALDFKSFEMVSSNTYATAITIAKRTTFIVAILVVVVSLGGFNFRSGIFTQIACIATRQ